MTSLLNARTQVLILVPDDVDTYLQRVHVTEKPGPWGPYATLTPRR